MEISSTAANASPDTMNYALQVALQTMKERCIQLQKRLSNVEDENQKLRDECGSNKSASNQAAIGDGTDSDGVVTEGATEIVQLRLQVKDLERQKAQLTEHINMVSNENRKLWSRLSQMSKEQMPATSLNRSESQLDTESASPRGSVGGANQNLIRSKTFTQHSPNPHLRQKMISDGLKDISLEEIALNADLGAGDAYANAEEIQLGYPYIQDDTSAQNSELEFHMDAKRCMEGLQELRREAMKQQQELSSALTVLESRFALQPCAKCIQKAQKPEMADKSLETDESMTELKMPINNPIIDNNINGENSATAADSNGHNGHHIGGDEEENKTLTSPSTRLNIIQEKIKADGMDKICPMCGKLCPRTVSFRAFQEHVEMHFIDDTIEVENSIERNFEFISHAVGDF